MLDEAAAMKAVLKIPVITPAIHTPENAENAIAHGKTDMVSLCRPLIADPQWVAKVANGEEHTIRKCIRCLGCLHRLRRSLGLRCEVNGKSVRSATIRPTIAFRHPVGRSIVCLEKRSI